MALILRETLTKENFWNEMMANYPKATKEFCEWIDEYKKAVDWDHLFISDLYTEECAIKFHDLPYEMQQGIWIKFADDTLNKYFEQPEYIYLFDLEEDIKSVFSEIETLIED